jgi:hypothetical protein
MKKLLFAFLSATLLFVTSCKNENDPAPPASTTDPKAGSKWVYKYTSYNEAGTVTGTSNLTYNGVEVVVGGTTWLNLVDQGTGNPVIAIQKRTEGWWYISYPTPTPSLWFKYPATLNETYAYVFGTCVVKDINASVVVPAGTFNGCYKVDGNDTNSLEDEFWFTTTGPVMVKFNTYDQKAAGPASNVYRKESLELVSFTR